MTKSYSHLIFRIFVQFFWIGFAITQPIEIALFVFLQSLLSWRLPKFSSVMLLATWFYTHQSMLNGIHSAWFAAYLCFLMAKSPAITSWKNGIPEAKTSWIYKTTRFVLLYFFLSHTMAFLLGTQILTWNFYHSLLSDVHFMRWVISILLILIIITGFIAKAFKSKKWQAYLGWAVWIFMFAFSFLPLLEGKPSGWIIALLSFWLLPPNSTPKQPSNTLFYDGVCGLCNHCVQWIQAEHKDLFNLQALQSEIAKKDLPTNLPDSIVLKSETGLYLKSQAVLKILHQLGGIWLIIGLILHLFPKKALDFAYDYLARNRNRFFGTVSCKL